MDHKNINDVEELDELTNVSMKIILHAGDARLKAEEAIELAKQKDINNALILLDEAQIDIRKAHTSQTTIIQNEMSGIKYDISLLFNHAQDTLMTVMSEIKLTRAIIELYEVVLEENRKRKQNELKV